ncbi:MAG: hypothetical protein K9W43_11970 [Candidatus Thorarchaeota archaeon]|nr:hypothetical protein [Candidatus Thorarchaeota archaeon]
MQDGLLDPQDLPLISIELLIAIGFLMAFIFAFMVQSKHPKLTSKGWNKILAGLFFLMLHGIFDALDTLQFDDFTVDLLNVLDGSCFVIGLLLFALGIYGIAVYGASLWEVQ